MHRRPNLGTGGNPDQGTGNARGLSRLGEGVHPKGGTGGSIGGPLGFAALERQPQDAAGQATGGGEIVVGNRAIRGSSENGEESESEGTLSPCAASMQSSADQVIGDADHCGRQGGASRCKACMEK